jgi:hypothetical protein
MAARTPAPRGGRRGEGIVDHLLVLTIAFVVAVVAAYVWMPDTRRALGTVITDTLDHFGFEVE